MQDSESLADYVALSSLHHGYDPIGLQRDGVGFRSCRDGVETVVGHSGEEMRSIAYIEFKTGMVRGGHYHRFKTEYICVVKGRLQATYYLPSSADRALTATLDVGDSAKVSPGCVHSYRAEGFAAVLEFSPQPFDEADTVRVPVGVVPG